MNPNRTRLHDCTSARRHQMRGVIAVAALVLAFAWAGEIAADEAPSRTPSTPGTVVYIISPADGAAVTSPVTVLFGLKGMGVAPAGVQRDGTGHHHLIIDAPLPPLDQPVPADAHHKHFGAGQTEATIELAPGTHTLQLLLADYLHSSFDPPVLSEVVAIEVSE